MDGQADRRINARNGVHAASALLLTVAFVAGPGGCAAPATAGNNPDEAELEPHARPPVADLPIPTDFALIEEVSRSYEARGVRLIDHVYHGQASPVQLERFYRKQLPGRGWAFQNAQMVRGMRLLRFEKDEEVLDVQIESDDRPFRDGHAQIKLTLQAIGSGPPELDF